MRDEILKAKNIEKSFGSLRVLNNINLTISKGEKYALFGSNGAGKTTLIKILSTILPPDSGELTLFGKKCEKRLKNIKSKIGFMSHNTFLYNDLSAIENLNFYANLYSIKNKDERIENLLKEVGLYHRSNDRIGLFSRGMKQRISLARSILHNPEIIFLDEPFAGLDVKAQKILNEVILRLNQHGTTFIFIIHNIGEIIDITDRIGILSKGEIVYEFEGDKKKDFSKLYQAILRRESS